MTLADRAALAAFRLLDPERAHGLALRALATPLAPAPGPFASPRLAVDLAGMSLPNPLGLAAGFDKNATAVAPLSRSGFGWIEVGAATPEPQPGNPRPRLFRLRRDRAVINRFGFNNDGAHAIADRLAAHRVSVPVGLNLGANRDSPDRARDYAEVLRIAGAHVDFATVNVSSPNTERLRDLQGADALRALLSRVIEARAALPRRPALFLKIAPDLTDAQIAQIAEVALGAGIDGIIATNTTTARDGLRSRRRDETGGLSGRPLLVPSTRVLARLSRETGGALPLIGTGGVSTARHAYEKIRAGATAIQLYTALTYGGLSLVPRILRGLEEILQNEGFARVADAVGTGVDDWI